MIVGNGDVDAGVAPDIDAADVVMRFNDCRSAGPGGTRTDIVTVCNTGRPGRRMLEDPAWRDNPSVRAAGSIWCVRDPAKFAAIRAPLAVTHPELDDFCDDYSEGFRAFAGDTAKSFHIVAAETHNALDAELAAYDPQPYVVPSTGLVAIAEWLRNIRQAGDRVSLVGFGHQGWEWHPWEAERRWVDARFERGELEKYGLPCYV